MDRVQLNCYSQGSYSIGAGLFKLFLWYFIGAMLVKGYWLPFSGLKIFVLKIFGAKVGRGVRVKPGVTVKFPWKLSIGDYSWIGEGVWIDNLAPVKIGSNCCISQSAYLCTGSHDWSKSSFDLIVKPIVINDYSWVAAKAVVAPGVTFGEGAVLGLASSANKDLLPWTIYKGVPAMAIGKRSIR